MLNVECKLPLAEPGAVVTRLRALGAREAGVLVQRDTYFRAAEGRLKLRETPGGAELIAYDRDERTSTLVSRYTTTPVDRPDAVRDDLAARLGVRGVVEKARTLWLYQNARIHLDQVAGVGAFLEIEVVEPRTTAEGEALLAELIDALALDRASALRRSYIDLLEAQSAPGVWPSTGQ